MSCELLTRRLGQEVVGIRVCVHMVSLCLVLLGASAWDSREQGMSEQSCVECSGVDLSP